jgi:prepilin-type N-terminal cleavage/methylation domain-containing protein
MTRRIPGGSRRDRGFTLIELVMVIVILGTLAVIALPRFPDTAMWRLRAFSDELISRIQQAQRLALSQRQTITAQISPSGVVFTDGTGAQLSRLDCPANTSPCIAESGSRTVRFNASHTGSAVTSTGSTLNVTVSHGNYSRVLQIEPETGLIRALS